MAESDLVPSPSPIGTIPLETAEAPSQRGEGQAMGRSYEEVARGMQQLGAGAEETAVPFAEAQAASDLQNQKVTLGPDGKVQVLNPARSLIFGRAGIAYGDAVIKGTAAQAETGIDQQLADIHLKHLGDPEGQATATQAFIAGLKGATGNPEIDNLIQQRAAATASQHQIANLDFTTKLNLQNQRTGLNASITSLEEQAASQARQGMQAGNPDFDKTMSELDQKRKEKQGNSLMKDPPELDALQRKQFDLRLSGERLVGGIPSLIDKNGMNEARRQVHDMLDNAALEPSVRSRLKFEANQALAAATPAWNSDNRGFDVTVNNLQRDFAAHKGTGPQSLSAWGTSEEGQSWSNALINAMRLGRDRGFEREPEVEALAAAAPWLKSMATLSPDQRKLIVTPYTPEAPIEPGGTTTPAPAAEKEVAPIQSFTGGDYGRQATAGAQPFTGIVIHMAGKPDLQSEIQYNSTPDAGRGNAYYGYHYLIDRDGKVYQTAPDNVRTNHIMPNAEHGLNNSNAIGISFIGGAPQGQNPLPPTPEQLKAGKALTEQLEKKYHIDPKNVVSHGELDPKTRGEGSKLNSDGGAEGKDFISYIRGGPAAPTAAPAVAAAGETPKVEPAVLTTGVAEGATDYRSRVAQIESSGGRASANIYQFMGATAAKYGYHPGMSRADQDAAFDRLTADNREALRNGLGREPTDAELYLAHQQGAQGALHLMAEPSRRAGDVVGDAAINGNGGNSSMTAGDFVRMWEAKYGGTRGGPPAPDGAGGFSYAQIRANPWLLAVQTMGMDKDPAEHMAYFDALLKTNTEMMKLGNLPNPGQWAEIERIHSDHADDPRFEGKYADAAGQLAAVSAEGMPAAQRQQFDAQVAAAAADMGGNPWTRALAISAQNHVRELDDNWDKHTQEMAARTGMIPRQAVPLNFTNPQAMMQSLTERNAISEKIGAMRGGAVPPAFDKGSDDLNDVKRFLDVAQPDQKAAFFGMLSSALSEPVLHSTLRALGGDDSKNMAQAAAGGLMKDAPGVGESIIRGLDAMQNERFDPEKIDKQSFRTGLDNALPPAMFDAVSRTAPTGPYNVLATMVRARLADQASGSGNFKIDNPVVKAAVDAVTGGTATFNQGQVIVPQRGMSEADFGGIMQGLTDADFRGAHTGSGEPITAAMVKRNGKLESAGDGKYHILFAGTSWDNPVYAFSAGGNAEHFTLDLTGKVPPPPELMVPGHPELGYRPPPPRTAPTSAPPPSAPPPFGSVESPVWGP